MHFELFQKLYEESTPSVVFFPHAGRTKAMLERTPRLAVPTQTLGVPLFVLPD